MYTNNSWFIALYLAQENPEFSLCTCTNWKSG